MADEARAAAAEAADRHDPVRRSMLAAIGGTLGVLTAGSALGPLSAQEEEKDSEGIYRDGVFSSYYRPQAVREQRNGRAAVDC